MKKVAIDTGPLTGGHAVRGIGVHTRELLNAIDKIGDKNVAIESVDFSTADLSKYDLVHYQYFNPYFFSLPFKKPTKVLVTIHDLIYLRYPKAYPPGLKGSLKFIVQKHLIKRLDGVLTISETSKKDIIKFLGVHSNKVNVVHLAPRKIFKQLANDKWKMEIKKRYRLPERFVLYVGDVNYNKNIPTLLKASRKAGIALVIVGKQALDIENVGLDLPSIQGPKDWIRFLLNIPHPELAHYKYLLQEFKKSKKIYRLGFVPDEDLAAIYNLATIYCQPSYYEGFGLGILDAMACGIPVVASDISAHREIAGGSCVFVNPKNVDSFVVAFDKVYKDVTIRKILEEKGLEQAKNYSWEKTAEATLKVYEKVLKSS